MRLLLVEDSVRLRESLTLGLTKLGHQVDSAGDGEQGLWHAKQRQHDVLILDLMIPRVDGMSVLRQIRSEGNPIGVLILTAKDRVEDKITGLRIGADDYLTKPFSFDELLARIESIARRRAGGFSMTLSAGPISVDLDARHASVANQPLELTAREYAVLEFLLKRKNQIVSRTQIEEAIYSDEVELSSNVVDTIIYSLRRKLEPSGAASHIRTVRNMGYELTEAT